MNFQGKCFAIFPRVNVKIQKKLTLKKSHVKVNMAPYIKYENKNSNKISKLNKRLVMS